MRTPLEVDTVLVPIDGSDESVTAVEYAATVATEYDASVHAIYVLGEAAARAVETGAVDPDDMAAEGRARIDTIEAAITDADVRVSHSVAYGFSTRRKLVHPGNVILDAAEQIDADFLVIPRESTHRSDDILEKAAEHVLLYASQPVLSV
jgi:nucleotide-binding universal stress UspA family protein